MHLSGQKHCRSCATWSLICLRFRLYRLSSVNMSVTKSARHCSGVGSFRSGIKQALFSGAIYCSLIPAGGTQQSYIPVCVIDEATEFDYMRSGIHSWFTPKVVAMLSEEELFKTMYECSYTVPFKLCEEFVMRLLIKNITEIHPNDINFLLAKTLWDCDCSQIHHNGAGSGRPPHPHPHPLLHVSVVLAQHDVSR